MEFFLKPSIALMQRLRLFPKFVLVAVLFAVPVILVTGLLINELDKSISFTEQERLGLQQIREIHELSKLAQQHRALRRLALAGNAAASDNASKIQNALSAKLNTNLDPISIPQLTNGQLKTPVSESENAVSKIKQSWANVVRKLASSKASESYADHTVLIDQLNKLSTTIANHSKLSLDPEVDTYYLIGLFAKTFPELAEGIFDIASRGAPYIDTGLLEANEDVLLNADVMLAKRDIARIPAQFEAMFQENPTFKTQLKNPQALLANNLAFLERAKNEILNTLNQTSGTEFLAAGSKSAEGLYDYADAAADLLDVTLKARIDRAIFHRNILLGASLIGLLISAYLLAGFYASFSQEVRKLSASVASVAGGDLTTSIDSQGTDEVAQLLHAFDLMRINLATLVNNIRHGTEAIANASSEIAHGNADLSTRTEQQAGSLEETSASMEELTNAVKQNAASAEHANQNAVTASAVAKDGGIAVAEVINTMAAIQQSSKRINDIIGVIDGIAFQTNILALNAAVEAARAGEQGRGFAVVASEVRNLAQRSASAAKEIKVLITTSVEQVGVGSRQVTAAEHTMAHIVTAIHSMADNMSEITTASVEQRSGIEQVNQALGQMDDITQQNAALVEQAAAAAQSMHDQALHLAKAVSAFKTADMMERESHDVFAKTDQHPYTTNSPVRLRQKNSSAPSSMSIRVSARDQKTA